MTVDVSNQMEHNGPKRPKDFPYPKPMIISHQGVVLRSGCPRAKGRRGWKTDSCDIIFQEI